MKKIAMVGIALGGLCMLSAAQAETQSETIARVCAEYGQDSQECKNVRGNQVDLQLNLNDANAGNAAASVSNAADCPLPTSPDTNWNVMVDGSENIGTVKITAIETGPAMSGTIDGGFAGFEFNYCLGKAAVMKLMSDAQGPSQITLTQTAANTILLQYNDEQFGQGELQLMR